MRSTLAAATLVAGFALSACASRAPVVQYFPAATAPGQAPLPFSRAVRVGDLLILSGQIGTDSTGRLVSGGIEGETRQTL
ncbi:MAG TPA: RidA family protein, partial [Gemmatimonadaceae bacterium]|nr:RidA family protein [Gemmatimonadaceae bacterium]